MNLWFSLPISPDPSSPLRASRVNPLAWMDQLPKPSPSFVPFCFRAVVNQTSTVVHICSKGAPQWCTSTVTVLCSGAHVQSQHSAVVHICSPNAPQWCTSAVSALCSGAHLQFHWSYSRMGSRDGVTEAPCSPSLEHTVQWQKQETLFQQDEDQKLTLKVVL